MTTVRNATREDVEEILEMYRAVARIPGGLARTEKEVTQSYVTGFVTKALQRGITLVAIHESGPVVGEIHAARSELKTFCHVLTDLTIAVHPDCQRKGIARLLFGTFMSEVRSMADVQRVELIARESNVHALGFYESMGFVREGEFRRRVRSVDGGLEADIPMAWLR